MHTHMQMHTISAHTTSTHILAFTHTHTHTLAHTDLCIYTHINTHTIEFIVRLQM